MNAKFVLLKVDENTQAETNLHNFIIMYLSFYIRFQTRPGLKYRTA